MKNSDDIRLILIDKVASLLKKYKIKGWTVTDGQTYIDNNGYFYVDIYSEARYISWGHQTPTRVHYRYVPNEDIGVDVHINNFEMLIYDPNDSSKTKLEFNDLDVIKKLTSKKFLKDLHLLLNSYE